MDALLKSQNQIGSLLNTALLGDPHLITKDSSLADDISFDNFSEKGLAFGIDNFDPVQ